METTEKPQHIGRKIARIRELRGMKQEVLALELGVSQQSVSKIEQSEEVDKETLERVAKALGVTTDGIHKFNEEAVFNIISSTFNDESSAYAYSENYKCTFNPLDKVVELYERLLASEREKNEILKNGGGK